MASKTLLTAEEFDRLEAPEGVQHELDEGELVTMTLPRPRHNRTVRRITTALSTYVGERPHCDVFGPQALYVLAPDTRRVPDASIVFRDVDPDADIAGAPDLVVEVISPSDTVTDLRRKLRQYFAAGAKLAWIFYPDSKEVEVWRDGRLAQTLTESDTLDGGDLLPGFSIPVAKLF